MILYAVATDEGRYLRDRREGGVEVTGLDHCSVYPGINQARALAERFGIERTSLVELTLSQRTLAW